MRRLVNPHLCALLLGWLLIVLAPGRGFAQGASSPSGTSDEASVAQERLARAREHFLRGIALGREGKWAAALQEFQASRALHPTRASLSNVAVSLYRLGRYVEALEAYEVLDTNSAHAPSEERQRVRALVAKLRASVGEVLITSNAPEPSVTIDGQQYGRLPANRPVRVDPGSHRLHVSHPQYLPAQREFTIAAGQVKEIEITLVPLSEVSFLVVHEAHGRRVEVVLDGTPVGKTPLFARVPPGTHTIALRGPGRLGTVPVQTRVRPGQQRELTLAAVELDADVQIRVWPPASRVSLNGRPLARGSWSGRLPAGTHSLEVSAEGHVSKSERVALRPGLQVVTVRLDRATRVTFWDSEFVRSLYVEFQAGAAWAPSFAGGADAACARGDCRSRTRPFGAFIAVRPGYRIAPRLGIELLAGYLFLRGRTERDLRVQNTDPAPVEFAARVQDETRMSAPFAGFAAAYRLGDSLPLIARLSTGAARARVRTATQGRFQAAIPHPEYPTDPRLVFEYDERAGAVDEPQSLWVPFLSPEIRIGHAIGRHLTIDVGVAGWFLFAPSHSRSNGVIGGSDDRLLFLPEPRDGEGYRLDGRPGTPFVKPGIARLPRESALGMLFVLTPSIAARASF